MSLQPGSRLGPYEILSSIGAGGMGEVYRARDCRLDRDVAIKVLSEAVMADPDRIARLEREAKTLAALNHPNIVIVHSVESAGNVPFLTMELVDGKPLSEIIPAGGLRIDTLLPIAIALADAIAAVHLRHIFHRDLKPTNVMVTSDGRIKILDFGLAKTADEAPMQAASTQVRTTPVSLEGQIVGTVAYMSPEQAEGKAADHRSDIFSLGVMFHEMATGERPFTGETPLALMFSILRATPRSIEEVRNALPKRLGRIVKRCLAKDPLQRYQTAVELRSDLELLKQEVDSRALTPARSRQASDREARPPFVFASALIQRVLDQMRAVAQTDATVLIRGESGVGKELIARHIHEESARRAGSFVGVDCASIPQDVFDREFFGQSKEPSAAAMSGRVGQLEIADGGTLFLDHVEDIPPELQAKLLRLLQDSMFTRPGDANVYRADVRFIAATGRDLAEEVSQGRFRRDLYFRLSVFPIEIPPLRSRPEDIPVLVDHFLSRHADVGDHPLKRPSDAQMRRLQTYDWPGNVRELANLVERAVILAGDGPLRFDEALPGSAFSYPARAALPDRTPARGFLTAKEFERTERSNLVAAIEATGWRVTGSDGAAAQLGMTVGKLRSRMKALGITKPEPTSLYARLGGSRGIASLTRDLFGRAIAHPQLGRFWKGRSTYGVLREEQLLAAYLSSAAGGPAEYVGRDMQTAHHGLGITSTDWDIFRAILNETLTALNVLDPERREVIEFAQGLRPDIVED